MVPPDILSMQMGSPPFLDQMLVACKEDRKRGHFYCVMLNVGIAKDSSITLGTYTRYIEGTSDLLYRIMFTLFRNFVCKHWIVNIDHINGGPSVAFFIDNSILLLVFP